MSHLSERYGNTGQTKGKTAEAIRFSGRIMLGCARKWHRLSLEKIFQWSAAGVLQLIAAAAALPWLFYFPQTVFNLL